MGGIRESQYHSNVHLMPYLRLTRNSKVPLLPTVQQGGTDTFSSWPLGILIQSTESAEEIQRWQNFICISYIWKCVMQAWESQDSTEGRLNYERRRDFCISEELFAEVGISQERLENP